MRTTSADNVMATLVDGREEYYICVGDKKITCLIIDGNEGHLLTNGCESETAILPATMCRFEVLLHAAHIIKAPYWLNEMIYQEYIKIRMAEKKI